MDRLPLLRASVVGGKIDNGDLLGKLSERTMDQMPLLRESVVGGELDNGRLLGQAFQADRGPICHSEGVGGGLETR